MKPIFTALIAVAALASLAPIAAAGTYSVVGVEWYPDPNTPATGTDGGQIYFGRPSFNENPLDLHYKLQRSISAPDGIFVNTYANPVVQGMWRWKVRWVGDDANDPVPDSVLATIQAKGTGYGETAADCYWPNAIGHGYVQVSDPFFPLNCGSTADYYNVPMDWDWVNSSGSGSHTYYGGAAGWTHVSGYTYEGWVNASIQSQAYLQANGSQTQIGTGKGGVPIYRYESGGGALVNLAAIIRLTHIAGQRVQNDL